MRVTNRNARIDKSGRHNDRNFDLEKAPHINQNNSANNEYYTYNDERMMSFRDLELEFYHNHFEQALDRANEKHAKAYHKDRIKTVEKYYASKRTMPEDKILQIGTKDEHVTKEELWECALEYKDRFEDIFGDHCKILDMALHMDEETPHVHVRRVWIAEDEHGNEIVSENKALEQMGILPPNINKEIGRYNNAKMTFTQTDCELFKVVCREHGIDIDDEKTGGRTHYTSKNYKKIKEYDKTEQSVNDLARFIEENPYLINMYENQLKKAEGKDLSERNRVLVRIMIDAYESLHEQVEIANKYERVKEYIEEQGLLEDYDEWEDERYPEHSVFEKEKYDYEI